MRAISGYHEWLGHGSGNEDGSSRRRAGDPLSVPSAETSGVAHALDRPHRYGERFRPEVPCRNRPRGRGRTAARDTRTIRRAPPRMGYYSHDRIAQGPARGTVHDGDAYDVAIGVVNGFRLRFHPRQRVQPSAMRPSVQAIHGSADRLGGAGRRCLWGEPSPGTSNSGAPHAYRYIRGG